MRFLIVVFSICFALFIIGCGGSKPLPRTDESVVPAWFEKIPSDPNFRFGAKTATSRDMQMAIDKAALDGRAEIAISVNTKVSDLRKRFQEETGFDKDANLLDMYTRASKAVADESLSGSLIRQQKTFRDGDNWRAYVLVEYEIGKATANLLEEIKKQTDLYTKFQGSKAWKELEDEVKKYQESKQSEQPK